MRKVWLSVIIIMLGQVCALAGDEPAGASGKPHYWYPVPPANPPTTIESDLCVYGGTPAGITAAIQMRRMGKTAVLLAFNKHVGGMTSGGLSRTDIGAAESIGGLAQEFYKRLGMNKNFKPSAAEQAFLEMLKEAGVSASHIAYGSIRMEPVFMILGQSAGTAAAIVIDQGVPVQKVEYTVLKQRLLADGQILVWASQSNSH